MATSLRRTARFARTARIACASLGITLLACPQTRAADLPGWNQFRGPNGSGVAPDAQPPIRVQPKQPAWQTPIPPGKSSPVLSRDRVFLTGLDNGRLVTLAIDARSGRTLWKQPAPPVPLEPVHPSGSPAASTPCADGERVYTYFGSFGLLCHDHQGRQLWERPLPTPRSMYGVSTSPILHGDRLYLVLDDDANLPESQLSRSRLAAFDARTGATVWETPRPYNRGAWSTPILWSHDHGTNLVVLGNGRLYAYDPATGEEQWYVNGFAREPISVPVADPRHLFASVSMQGGRGDVDLDPEPFWTAMLHFDQNGDGRIGTNEITEHFTLPLRPEVPPGHPGFGIPLPSQPAERRQRQESIFRWRDKDADGFWSRAEFLADMTAPSKAGPNLIAIRPGGRGDVTESHTAWSLRNGIPEIPSPILHARRLYLLRDGGVLSCVNADTGALIYRERLGAAGQYAASPVIANDHLYAVSAQGVLTVVKTGPAFHIAHQTPLESPVAATPALDRNTLYIRTDTTLTAFR